MKKAKTNENLGKQRDEREGQRGFFTVQRMALTRDHLWPATNTMVGQPVRLL